MSTQNSNAHESATKKGILAGAILTVVEIGGGVASGSIGLLSSASSTLIDFVAALVAFFAVRESNKPPDERHMYGHEKIESAAALGEILLLFAICAWIAYNAVVRLLSGSGTIELFWVALGTNFVSIIVDSFAYLNLKRSSKVLKSEAIEANALLFLNDLLIAFVVIIGLGLYWFGIWYADSVAALVIIAFTLYSSMGVVKESASTLTDAAPRGVVEKLKRQILGVEGVTGCHHLRVRRAGAKLFVDAHVEIDGGVPLNQAHSIASRIEEQVVRVFPNSDVLIHTEPHSPEEPIAAIRTIASQIPEIKEIHEIIVKTVGSSLYLSYHLELESSISVKSAHEIADRLEGQIKTSLRDVSSIISHLEPVSAAPKFVGLQSDDLNRLRQQIVEISKQFPEIRSCHEIQILAHEGRYSITLHCVIDDDMNLNSAHEIATKMEEKIKAADPRIEQATIHCEPKGGSQ
jgi:cation diffusion facilitator family transporter